MTSDTLGAIVRQARDAAGQSQGELARKVGVADGTIWRLENDADYNPSEPVVRLTALTLGLDPNTLLRLREAERRERRAAKRKLREAASA